MRGLHYTACVIAVGTATAALAHGSATGIVKERMDGMIVLRDSMKAMGPMMLGKTEYDGAVVRARASAIRQHSGRGAIIVVSARQRRHALGGNGRSLGGLGALHHDC
jgi:cytochrome c556